MSASEETITRLSKLSAPEMVKTLVDEAADMERTPSVSGRDWTENEKLFTWWARQMSKPNSGLGERMAWFWHGLLTTNVDKVGAPQLVRTQMELLRNNSMGNYRELLQAFVVDGATLQYLDGAGSQAHAPNENLSRELMELFTLGRGNYTEDDVRAGAVALAGWEVDYETSKVSFNRQNSFRGPLMFLGTQDRWDTTKVVDKLCDQRATAVHVAARMWHFFVGSHLGPSAAAELGDWWFSKDLEITPLVVKILGSEGFSDSRMQRIRTGLEWHCAARAAVLGNDAVTETDGFRDTTWFLASLGQSPYSPPNVAGWPTDDRWIKPSGMLARSSQAHNIDFNSNQPISMSVEELLDRCGIHEVSDRTVNALTTAGAELEPEDRASVRWRLAITSPEFSYS